LSSAFSKAKRCDTFEDALELAQENGTIDESVWERTYEWFQEPNVKTDVSIEGSAIDPRAEKVLIRDYDLKESLVEPRLKEVRE
jgi:hypothetical protein